MKYIDAELLRKEIKRQRSLKSPIPFSDSYEMGCSDGYQECCDDILSFLDTLPEQPVGDTDGKAMLYVAEKSYKIGFRDGKASKEQPVEGLEDEYKDYVENDPVFSKLVNRNAGLCIARHFAEWGAKHLK